MKSKSTGKSADDYLCLNLLEKALAVRAAYKVKNTMTVYSNSKVTENEKVNSLYAMDIVQMSHSHIMFVTFKLMREKIETIKCSKAREHINNLAKILAITELMQDSSPNYECGFFELGTFTYLLEAAKKLCVILRPQMIPLTEAWAMPDSVLVSAIGNSYGDIYE